MATCWGSVLARGRLGEAGRHIQHSSSNSNGHLCADYLVDGGIREAVSGHEIDTHEVNARVKNDPGFVILCVCDDNGDDDGSDSRCKGESLRDLGSGAGRFILYVEEVGVRL